MGYSLKPACSLSILLSSILFLTSCLQSSNYSSKGAAVAGVEEEEIDSTDTTVSYPSGYRSYSKNSVLDLISEMSEETQFSAASNEIDEGEAPNQISPFDPEDYYSQFSIYLQGNDGVLDALWDLGVVENIQTQSTSYSGLDKYMLVLKAGVSPYTFKSALDDAGVKVGSATYKLSAKGIAKTVSSSSSSSSSSSGTSSGASSSSSSTTTNSKALVYRYYHKRGGGSNQAYVFTTDPYRAHSTKSGDARVDAFLAPASLETGSVAIHICKHKTAYKYILATACSTTWKEAGTVFYAYTTEASNRIPVYQLQHPTVSTLYIYMPNPSYPAPGASLEASAAAGWKNSGILFWIPK